MAELIEGLRHLPLLFLLLATPLAGIGLVWAAPARQAGSARNAALLSALATLGIALAVILAFDRAAAGFQLMVVRPWLPDLGIAFRVGVDGVSLLFLPATALLFAAAIGGQRPTQANPRVFFSLILLLEAATLGVFVAVDLAFFFLCWELTVLPLWLLIRLWGIGGRRAEAATQYALLMLAGGVPLLFGLLTAALAGPEPNFDLAVLLAQDPLPPPTQMLVLLLLLAGFAVKAPLVPLHAWLPKIALEGPVAVVALVAGVKLGVYGLLRLAVPLAPGAAASLAWLLAGLGVAGLLFGALAALAQTNLRSLLAYLGVSHVGLLLVGIAGAVHGQGVAALQGVLLLAPNFALVAGGGLLAAGFLHARTGSCDVQNLGGAVQRMPRLAAFFLLCGLAGLGLPLTSGFAGEWLLLIDTLRSRTGLGLAALAGTVIGAAAFLGLYRRCFFGPLTRAEVADAEDLLPREALVALAIGVVILACGLFPQLLLDLTRVAATAWPAVK